MFERTQITTDSYLLKFRPFDSLQITESLLEHYKKIVKWWRDEYNFYGKIVKSPRQVGFMSREGFNYRYSGLNHLAQRWDEETLAVLQLCVEPFTLAHPWYTSDFVPNGVLFNWYKNGQDSISAHSDDEAAVDLQSPIMSVNFGAERTFHIHNKTETVKIPLCDGDVIVMMGKFQQELKHSIPKEANKGERINLTFRKFK